MPLREFHPAPSPLPTGSHFRKTWTRVVLDPVSERTRRAPEMNDPRAATAMAGVVNGGPPSAPAGAVNGANAHRSLREYALRVSGLSKTFGATQALQDVAIDVRPGEIHALMGQNGSG